MLQSYGEVLFYFRQHWISGHKYVLFYAGAVTRKVINQSMVAILHNTFSLLSILSINPTMKLSTCDFVLEKIELILFRYLYSGYYGVVDRSYT